jgi:hypothetical protein
MEMTSSCPVTRTARRAVSATCKYMSIAVLESCSWTETAALDASPSDLQGTQDAMADGKFVPPGRSGRSSSALPGPHDRPQADLESGSGFGISIRVSAV